MTHPTWLHKRAPTGLKLYDAWSDDPTRHFLDTALDDDRERSFCWPCLAVAVVALVGGCVLAAWILK